MQDRVRYSYLRLTRWNLVFLGTLIILGGCSQLGPKFIEGSRTDYNIVMGETESEQMLLNLVRLRYGDAPYFLEATALNTQFLFSPSAEVGSTFDLNGNTTYAIKGKLAYEEKPTVTYSPLRGEDFVRQILSRISLETILLLDSSGWSTERVLRLCVENINGLDNASRASGPTPKDPPDIKEFNKAIELISSLESENALLVREKLKANQSSGYVISLSQDSRYQSRITELLKLLKIDPSIDEIGLFESNDLASSAAIRFQTRSFMGVMYFLAQSVEIPQEDYDDRKVATTLLSDGGVFNWEAITGSLAKVHSSPKRPTDAAIAVNYRDIWFYIADNDIRTKSTFQLLGQLFALQSRDQKGGAPLLTLPIGG